MNNLSVLQKFKEVIRYPYPHFMIEDALPEKVFKELEDTFPDQLVHTPKHLEEFGITYRYKSNPALVENKIPPIWQDFFLYHTSPEYFKSCIQIFGEHIRETYGESSYEILLNHPVTVRNVDNSGEFVTDCQFVINEPIPETQTSRPTHLDNPIEIYAGLIYFKKKEDESTGGNFTVYKKDEFMKLDEGRSIQSKVSKVSEVPYKRNVFCMFLNVGNSLHGVTPRINAKTIRRSINIIGEFKPTSTNRMW